LIRIAYLETVSSIRDSLELQSKKLSNRLEILHLLDETILQEIIETGKITAQVQCRIRRLLESAEKEACAILVTCSSIGEFCETLSLSIPIFRIDRPMISQAVNSGTKIAIIATLESTLVPTSNLIYTHSELSGKAVKVKRYLCSEAFAALKRGEVEKHDHLIEKSLISAFSWADVIILAQASMARVAKSLKNPENIPILNSIETGLYQIKDFVESKLSIET